MSSYDTLNDRQREAVFCTEGPLLVLAGAGSGKTRVLTHRIAYLIEEIGVPPYEILAITFTNKAAGEMKERVQNLVEYGDSVWVATFHSTCVRILRRFIDRLGYGTDFTIYDADDQKTAVRHAVKDLNLDPKTFRERNIAAFISACKNEGLTPDDAERLAGTDYRQKKEAEIYREYDRRLKENNALDFDDLLLKTVELFEKDEAVLSYYQRRFRYVLVDEYQDTNGVQFRFLYLLTKEHKNLMVVGDDDQSIYRFRGADIRNILEFEKHFPGATVVKLEQNYRSTTSILDVANAVIRHNEGRKEKRLWSELGKGQKVSFKLYDGAPTEAEEIIRKIRQFVRQGAYDYRDFAVLYRTNNQSRLFEEKCIGLNVPYTIVGGVNFYQRSEIKDLIAYVKTVATGKDSLAVARIINQPRRGIGDATVERLQSYADAHGLSLMEAIEHAGEVPGTERAEKKLSVFAHLIGELRALSREETISDFLRLLIEKTDYEATLEDLDEEKAEQKRQNIEELISKAKDFEDQWEGEEDPTLTDFLEEVALVADIDAVSDDDDLVLLMTLHSSKGLEFPVVFLAGMEEGMFPSYMSLDDEDPIALEEERRLCYVGMTRAKKELYLSAAGWRTVNGSTLFNEISRFVKEIPEFLLDADGLFRKPRRDASSDIFGGYGGSGGHFGAGSGAGMPVKGPNRPEIGVPRPQTRENFGKTFKVEKASNLAYAEGDRVRHARFGAGTVREITEGARDFEVTVDFDEFGEKRMYAGFAKLERVLE
ncbi:MAG: UvrD-helicase domain-containing protein [Lachnospiraceae bacterium]|nr:UvrD-helicase domain-containing protein [Lachnospiraceae bacterium]